MLITISVSSSRMAHKFAKILEESKSGRKDWAERKSQSQGGIKGGENNHPDHKRTRSTTSNNGRRRPMDSARTMSQTSNGDFSDECKWLLCVRVTSFLVPDDLDEPFTDSDEEFGPKQPQKMSLALPRGRIRYTSFFVFYFSFQHSVRNSPSSGILSKMGWPHNVLELPPVLRPTRTDPIVC